MNRKKTLLMVLLILVVLGGAGVLYRMLGERVAAEQLAVAPGSNPTTQGQKPEGGETEEEPPAKVPAPDFTVYDAEGGEVRLSDYLGKPIVLNFWASWCGPCRSEMGEFHETWEELGEEVQFLMVNVIGGRETQETAAKFLEEEGYAFPVFYDTTNEAAYAYGAYGLPTTYFIDAEGNAIAKANSAIDKETLMRGIDLIYSSVENSEET